MFPMAILLIVWVALCGCLVVRLAFADRAAKSICTLAIPCYSTWLWLPGTDSNWLLEERLFLRIRHWSPTPLELDWTEHFSSEPTAVPALMQPVSASGLLRNCSAIQNRVAEHQKGLLQKAKAFHQRLL